MKKDTNLEQNELISSLVDDHRGEMDFERELDFIGGEPRLGTKWSRYHLIRNVIQNDYTPILSADFASKVHAAIANEPSIVAKPQSVSSTASVSAPVSTASDSSTTVTQLSDARKRASAQPAKSIWNRNLKGFAVAASVALMALVGLNLFQNQNDLPASDIVAIAGSNSGSTSSGGASDSAQPSDAQPRIFVDNNASQLEFVSNSGTYWVSVGEQKLSPANEQRLNMYLSQHMESSPTAGVQGMLPYSRLAGYDSAIVRKRNEKRRQ